MYSDGRTFDLGWGFGIRVRSCRQTFSDNQLGAGCCARSRLPGYTAFSLEDIGDIRHSRVSSSRQSRSATSGEYIFGEAEVRPRIDQLALYISFFPEVNVPLADNGRPSRIVHKLSLLVVLIEFGDRVAELGSGLNDRNRR